MADIQIGQVYRDKDKRMLSGNRYLVVMCLGIPPAKVELAQCRKDGSRFDSERRYKISRKNLRTRFELVKGVD